MAFVSNGQSNYLDRLPLVSNVRRYMGAFHWTKFSGLKFRVFHATNGTVFSGSLD